MTGSLEVCRMTHGSRNGLSRPKSPRREPRRLYFSPATVHVWELAVWNWHVSHAPAAPETLLPITHSPISGTLQAKTFALT